MARAASNPKPKPLHPPYLEMISEAISSLKERTGSSQHAIAKFIQEKYKPNLPTNFKVVLSIQLKKFAKSEKLVKVKNSFKLPSAGKSKRVSVDVEEEKKQKDKVKRVTEKAKKMKRLSQVKTPPALKKKNVSMQTRVPKKINSPKKTRV